MISSDLYEILKHLLKNIKKQKLHIACMYLCQLAITAMERVNASMVITFYSEASSSEFQEQLNYIYFSIFNGSICLLNHIISISESLKN